MIRWVQTVPQPEIDHSQYRPFIRNDWFRKHYMVFAYGLMALLTVLLFVTGVLTAVTTAFCGPVVFIGLAVPHIARMLLGTDNHKHLMPATILTGAAVALLCNIICMLPGSQGIIPLNAITPFIGAPVTIYVIMKQRIKQ